MQNDHLEDAVLFLRAALEKLTHGYPGYRNDIERAIEEIELERPDLKGLEA